MEKPRKVYRISVSGVHEYFAGGVFQSNCFASVYSWRAAKSSGAGSDVREKTADANPLRTKLIQEKFDVLARENEDDADLGAFADDLSGRNQRYRGVSGQWGKMLGLGRR